MKKAFNCLRYFWKLYFALVFLLSLFLFYPVFATLLSRERWFNTAFRLMRVWAQGLLLVGGIRYRVIQRESLPAAPFIICPNHTSYLDIVLTYAVFKDYFVFMGKQELKRAPLFNIFFKRMNILVNRKSITDSHRAYLQAAAVLDKKQNLALFPEGTISKQAPLLLPFKNGPFRLAIEKQAAIVPVTFINNWNIFQDGAFFKARCRPGTATVIIHPAVSVEGMGEKDLLTLKAHVYNIIHQALKPYEH